MSYFFFFTVSQVTLRKQAEAETVLGELYCFGVNKCERKAFFFLSAAVHNGHPRAQYLLGIYYFNIQMYAISNELFRKSAEQGYTPAIDELCSRGWNIC